MKPSSIHPDEELRDFLQGKVTVGVDKKEVAVYGDWEKPTNGVPDDFIVVMLNGDISGVGMDTPYAEGYIMLSLYSRLNDDGSVKKNRRALLLDQFDHLVDNLNTEHYFYAYPKDQFMTPTTPNITSGYSVTTLNLKWNTNSSFNK